MYHLARFLAVIILPFRGATWPQIIEVLPQPQGAG